MAMNPLNYAADQQSQRYDAEHHESPTNSSIFIAHSEFLGAAIMLGIAVHFFTVLTEPDSVAWGLSVIAVALLFDATRRIVRIARGKDLV